MNIAGGFAWAPIADSPAKVLQQQLSMNLVSCVLSCREAVANFRKARAAVNIPPEYNNLQAPLTVTPAEVEDAFIKANPGLTPSGIAVECSRSRMSEVRLCLSKDLKFRDCPEVASAAAAAIS